LAVAVLGTAPLATWGGGCSSSLKSVQPDGGGGTAGSTGGTTGAAGTMGAGGGAGTSGVGGQSGSGGGGGGAGGCPACCDPYGTSYCSAEGNYMSCLNDGPLSSMLPAECASVCPVPGYVHVWRVQICANGCNGPGPDGGIGGGGGAPGCAPGGTGGGIGGQSGVGGPGGQSGYSGGLCADGSGGATGGSTGGAAGGSTGGAPVCCPQCCSQPNVGPHCTDDGHHYLSCYMVPSYSFPASCGNNCGVGYVWVWQARSCANGCVNPAGGASGGGGGGAPGCQ
jgi:hypothetical protein